MVRLNLQVEYFQHYLNLGFNSSMVRLNLIKIVNQQMENISFNSSMVRLNQFACIACGCKQYVSIPVWLD